MDKLGAFNPTVVECLNKLFKKFPIAPGYGNNDEGTYYVGRCIKQLGYVEDWVSLDQVSKEKWGKKFLTEWNQIKDMELFVGEIYYLEYPKRFLVGEGFKTEVIMSDRVVRCFRKNTVQTVLDILGQAYHILYNPVNLATDTQGVIGKISINDYSEIPTLVFEVTDF